MEVTELVHFLSYKRSKLKLRVFLVDHIVAMVTSNNMINSNLFPDYCTVC